MSEDWEYAEAARIERHQRNARPDPNTGFYDEGVQDGDVEDAFWNQEQEDEELEELSE